MHAIAKLESTDVEAPFIWRSLNGQERTPSEMATSHLFHTLRMIWNNFMPQNVQVGKVKIYHFDERYPPEYMRRAAAAMLAELQQRGDLTADQRQQVWQMRAYALRLRLLEPA